MKNKLVILIGSGGFLGKNLKEILPSKTLYPSKKQLNLKNFNGIVKYLKNFKNFKNLIIINCACHVGNVHYGSKYPADIIFDNAIMSLNLYKACSLIKNQVKIVNPFANCSYPENTLIQREKEWLNGSPHESVLSYGTYKRFLYALSVAYFRQHNIKSINWMFGGGYGPNASINENKEHALNGMIIRMIKSKRENKKKFIVWGSGKPIREWVYIKDMANIIKSSLNLNNQIYPVNFGQKKGYSIAQTANIIKNELNFNVKFFFDKTKKDGDKKKVLDNKQFKKIYPKFKFTPLKKGILETIKHFEKKI